MIGVLANPGSWYLKDLQRAAKARGKVVVPLSFKHFSARLQPSAQIVTQQLGDSQSIDLAELDSVIVRTMPPGTLEQVVFRMNVLHRVQAAGVPVINPPRSLEIAIDKYLALAQLQAAGVLVPPTRTSEDCDVAMQDFSELGGDVVVKPIFGAEGRGITRIADEAIAWRTFRTLSQLGVVIYQQQFVPHHGYDLRVLNVGGRMHAIRRVNPSDWRTNVSRGARAEYCPLDDTMVELAERATTAVGAQVVGVDLLPGEDGKLYTLEVNAVPGWRALAKTLKVDVAADVLDFVVNCTS